MNDMPPAPYWFKVDNYAYMKQIDYRGWATQIGNRFRLDSLLQLELNDVFDEEFAKIMSNPFFDLGAKSSNRANPTDKTLYPLTVKGAKTIVEILSAMECEDHEHCDDQLRKINYDMFSRRGHLLVDLSAPKTLLKAQFKEWLDSSENSRMRGPAISPSVIQYWAIGHPILPYRDLWLWHKRYSLSMPSDYVIANWLNIEDKDAARITREKASSAFTFAMVDDLKFSASAAK
jgi:hypothetical protein